ncbi:sigma-54-dependent Fis family transcriptional regulator [Marinobacter caseinilyticus]|uniref:sigma-54-dependent Fis family transcriptional regulator n=1 Tax=Marinobacter caseinilyticus TaxID=2692195 RepID=UPI001F19AFCD|nr:sigma-54-dependent Fis family transcriptional regulator [Marinobacter caseinilyticus]
MSSASRKREFADVIAASWDRCRAFGLSHNSQPQPTPLDQTAWAHLKDQHKLLVETTECEVLPYYENILSNSKCLILLADHQGRVLNSWGDQRFIDADKKSFLQAGTSWLERTNGTNAIGTSIACGHAVQIQRNEHFLKAHRYMIGSASPIFDVARHLIGVLNVSSDAYLPQAHTLGMVKLMSQSVENRLLIKNFGDEHFLLTFHTNADNLDSQWSGVIAFDANNTIVAANRRAEALLKTALKQRQMTDVFACNDSPLNEQPDLVSLSLKSHLNQNLYGILRRPNQDLKRPVTALETPSPLSSVKRPGPTTPIRLQDIEFGDPAMKRCIEQTSRVIDKDIPILIHGDTGVGKEVLVKALHRSSNRREHPVVAVNCAAIPAELVESELFGYEKGAFTGANTRGAMGLIRKAHRGVLFLDEIGEMPLQAQARLLRVLQEREVTPLGSTETYPVDIRLICATNRSLRVQVDQGRFRQDLFYRVSGLSVGLPTLSNRTDRRQIFCQIHARYREPDQVTSLPDSILDLFERHPWPGNIRQLINVVQVALAMADKDPINMWHLPDDFLREVGAPSQSPLAETKTVVDGEPAISKPHPDNLLEIYSHYQGNVSKTARYLGASRNTVYKRLRELGAR